MACNRWVAALALVGLLCFLALSALLSLIFQFEQEQAAAIVGIAGNLCLFLAILNWAELRESPVNIYLCAKALFDSLYLTAFQGQYYNWSSTSYFLCIAEEQLNLFARQASVSIIIALIIERFLASMCPDECEKSPRISRLKVIVLFTMPALLWEFFLSITTYTDHQIMAGDFALVSQKCMHVQNGLRQISRFVYYMWNFFVPVLLFFLTNFLIAFKARYAPNANFIAIKDSGSRRSRRSSMVASGRCSTPPMESLAPFLFPLAFVLLNSPIYILYFTIPPTSPEFSQNAVQNMNIVARMLNDCYFALNLPLFALARAIN